MQGKKQFQEKLFTTFHLSDHVPEDNFYRRLKELLPLQWIYKETAKYYGTEGQQSIDPVVFFKLMLIGYLENSGSDRRIISMASLRLDMLYFLGYNIDEALPWHSTLSRTRQIYGQEIFRALFKRVLTLCIEKQMVAGKRQAMDSVFVQANASMESLKKKEIINDVDYYVDELDIEEEAFNIPLQAKIIPLQMTSEKDISPKKNISNSEYCSTTDADSRVSVKPGKARRLNYFAQVSVDTANHVITHIQSDYADKKDSQCLPSLLENTIANLSENDLQIEEILADGNYSSSEALRTLEENGIKGYIPNFGQFKASREGFEYNEEKDCFICSQGKFIEYKSIRTNPRDGGKMKQYRSIAKDCSSCPLKNQCIGKSSFKTLSVTVEKELFERMHARLQTPKARQMKKLRSSTVEPVLGTLVNFLGMRRVNTKGIKQADKCMLMSAVAYNLKKLMKWESKKRKSASNTIFNEAEAIILGLISAIKPFYMP